MHPWKALDTTLDTVNKKTESEIVWFTGGEALDAVHKQLHSRNSATHLLLRQLTMVCELFAESEIVLLKGAQPWKYSPRVKVPGAFQGCTCVFALSAPPVRCHPFGLPACRVSMSSCPLSA